MRRKARAFTLIEVVVALAITLVLAATLVVVVRGLLNVWQRSQGAGVGAIEAKLALDQLERDIQATILRPDGNAWLDVRVLADSDLAAHGWTASGTLIKPVVESMRLLPNGPITEARFGRGGVWLRLVTSDYDGDAGETQPVAVSYQVVRRAVSSGAGAPVGYALFREKMSAKATFDEVVGDGYAASGPSALTSVENGDVLASNVVDFGVGVFGRAEDGRLERLFPMNNAVPNTAPFPAAGEPVVVEVLIRVLSDRGAALVEAMESGRVARPAGQSAGEWWWSVVEAHSRVYSRRIEVKARAW